VSSQLPTETVASVEVYQIVFSFFLYWRELKDARLFFRKVACTWYDVACLAEWTDFVLHPLSILFQPVSTRHMRDLVGNVFLAWANLSFEVGKVRVFRVHRKLFSL
jgi:hypothetical protein